MIELQPDLEPTTDQARAILGAWLAGPVSCSEIVPLAGGLVNSVFRLRFDRPPHRAVVKIHGSGGDTFASEARALGHLAAATACPVPGVLLHDSSARLVPYSFLLLEEVPGVCLEGVDLDPAERAAIDVQLAEILGELHEHHGDGWGGLDDDDRAASWPDLFESRLVEVRAQPTVRDRLSPGVLAMIDESIGLTREALCDSGEPTLVHGDVWDGNTMARREDGSWRITGLLDPDLQYADVELELAYLEVFDASRAAFFDAYTERRPLRPGYERRRLFYWLHTALVHVALFGDEFFCDFTARTAETIVRDPAEDPSG